MKVSGSCLCQKVTFTFETEKKEFDACHCSMCRKWGGGPALTVEAGQNLLFEGDENISLFSSSKWAERGFCKHCGSNLFYRLKNHPFINFNLGTIDQQADFVFTKQIYVDHKVDNYSFANETQMMTEQEVIDSFGMT